MSGNPYRATEVFKPILENCSSKNVNDYLNYAEFLRKAGLHDTCLMTIYMVGSHFRSEDDRKLLGDFLIKTQKMPQKIDDSFLNGFMKK